MYSAQLAPQQGRVGGDPRDEADNRLTANTRDGDFRSLTSAEENKMK
jgi:hypothetical protein